MKIPVSWLKQYVELTLPLEEIAYRLTLAGLEVSEIRYIGLPAQEVSKEIAVPVSTDHLIWDREKLVVAHILEVKPHPDADKLVLAMVDSGTGEIEQVVTGAPNLYPYVGKGLLNPPLVTPYAREGAQVLDGHKDDGSRLIIKPKKLRGIENKSMVCSAKELGFYPDHEGIMLLEEVTAPPGTPLQDVLGDAVLEVELTPNMARNFSIVGIAREVAALTGQTVRPIGQEIMATGPSIDGQAAIEIQVPVLNPRFTLALLKGVTIGPSPEWMQRRLRLAGMRPINNIVDITNYVMLETGQPLHAFDYDILAKRSGGIPTIITRLPSEDEKLTTLDGIERDLDSFTILVADKAGALSLGGIMGGAESEIHDGTRNVLLEAANWDFINIRQTLSAQRGRGTAISSEAGARFSRGVHPAQAEIGLRRAIEMMRQLAGGEIAQGILDSYPLPASEVITDLPLSEVERILGLSLSQDDVAAILEGLSFKVEKLGPDKLRVTTPPYRMDIGYLNREEDQDIAETIAHADLIEEIARIYGYDRIPNTMLIDELPPQRNNDPLVHEERLRSLLVQAGLQEIVTYRLTTPEAEAQLNAPGMASSLPDVPYITLANAIASDKTVMRHTLLGGLLATLAHNTYWQPRQALFEIGKVYLPQENELLPAEPLCLAIGMVGQRGTSSWLGDGAAGTMDFFDIKGVIEAIIAGLHVEDIAYEAAEHSSMFPGKTARLSIGNQAIGYFGELHPLVAQRFGLQGQPVMVAELDISRLLPLVSGTYPTSPLSIFPAIYQDIAVVVNEAVAAADVEMTIRQAGGELLRNVRLFDVFAGEQLGTGVKSLAYRLTIQSYERTLQDKDAAKVQKRIVDALQSAFNATLRS